MKKKNNAILIVDDDTSHRIMLKTLLSGWGYEITEADDGSVAISKVKERYFDLILMDIRMIKVSGIEALEQIKSINPAIPVLIMTAYSSIETAVEALKKGAYDYLTKPLDFEKLKLTIERATENMLLRAENQLLKMSLEDRFDKENIIARSPSMVKLLETVAHVAQSDASVLITGESGTGKELIAGATHYNSPRRDAPFIKINCAAITETLLESELFGHEKGAFTGAQRRKEGKFVLANGGSIFLDEVSETPLSMQVKLLRVIQEREITRVGGEDILKVDVRIIAATNRDLKELILKGEFREDLYYRLNVVDLFIPPLRERKEDIPLIAQRFLQVFSDKNGKKLKGFTPKAMAKLINHDWPGNVRELINAIERGVVLSQSEFLDMDDFLTTAVVSEKEPVLAPSSEALVIDDTLTLEKAEKTIILKILESVNGNKSEAARRLGITRKTLHKKLKEYGMNPE